MNKLLQKIKSKDVTEDNDLLYLGAALVTKVFAKKKTKGGRNSLDKKEDWKVELKSITKICEA